MIKIKDTYGEHGYIDYRLFFFPAGEAHIVLSDDIAYLFNVDIEFEYENDCEWFQLLLIAEVLRRNSVVIDHLYIPYIPCGRQDRANSNGEAFSLRVVADIINRVGANTVHVVDPHSYVSEALINNCKVTHQYEVLSEFFSGKENYWLVSPDAGAAKKIWALAKVTAPLGVLECGKQRDVLTGEIMGVTLPMIVSSVKDGAELIICDDIADGGASFVYLAKNLKSILPNNPITLMVSHGIFSRGLEVFDGLIEEIYTRKGRVK